MNKLGRETLKGSFTLPINISRLFGYTKRFLCEVTVKIF